MSYRAFKRLLGETSLERQCRWLLGAGVLLLMTGSFWVYARQTEDLAYEQLATTGRALLSHILARSHVKGEQLKAVEDFQRLAEQHWPETLKGYSARLIKPTPKDADRQTDPENQPTSDDLPVMHRIQNDPDRDEETRQVPKENAFYYYGAIRASRPSCVECHRDPNKVGEKLARPNLQQDDLMAV